jgi:hypothetical protein
VIRRIGTRPLVIVRLARASLDTGFAAIGTPYKVDMVKNLWCRLGRHAWVDATNDDGERYRECRRCGAIKDDELPPGFGTSAITPGI